MPSLPQIQQLRGGRFNGSATSPGSHASDSFGSDMKRKHDGKFSRLKSVLVSNLLKEYHQKAKRQADESIYALALQEVEKILISGKLTERKLHELQKNFAKAVPQGSFSNADLSSPAFVQQADEPVSPGPSNMNFESVGNSQGGKKATTNKVDEWSLLMLYDDVKHVEEVKAAKLKIMAEKQRTRDELQRQIDQRKHERDAARASELEEAHQQQMIYESWKKEKAKEQEERLAKIMKARDIEFEEIQKCQERKKIESEQEKQKELERMHELQVLVEEEKKHKEQAIAQRKAQYQQTLIENQRNLQLKKELQDQDRRQDERLFQMQLEMAEKQERYRAEHEQNRVAKLKAAERAAGILGNRAAELEAQVEERVRRADQERQLRDEMQERIKREQKEKRQHDVLICLQGQLKERDEARVRRVEEERALAVKLKEEAEAAKLAAIEARTNRRRVQLNQRAQLDKQVELKRAQQEQLMGMSETEMRINATMLQKVAIK